MDGWAEYLNIMEHALIRVNLNENVKKWPQDCGYNGAENTGEKKEEKKKNRILIVLPALM